MKPFSFSWIFNYAAEICWKDSLQGGRAGQISRVFPPLDYIFLFSFHDNFNFLAKEQTVYGGKAGTWVFLNVFIFSC